jgi:aryl-alcohol dehydrogenase-like predicted oxidoreductase
MERRVVPGTDLSISRLVMGTMTFGSQVGSEDAKTMVDLSIGEGINMFDTAANYNGGESERILGSLLKGRRNDVLVATKVHPSAGGLGRAAIHKAIDASLDRLQTDHVDVYYLHQPDPKTAVEETLGAMNELVSSGKVRFIGVSNYAAWQVCDLRARSDEHGWQKPAISQQMYSLVARRIEEEYAAYAATADLFDIAYNPLAGGLLTGKHQPSTPSPAGTRFSQEGYRTRYWNDSQFDAVEKLKAVAQHNEMTLLDLSFRWLLGRALVDAILLGASSVEHLRMNLAAAKGADLPPDVESACDEAWRELRGVAPAYNR